MDKIIVCHINIIIGICQSHICTHCTVSVVVVKINSGVAVPATYESRSWSTSQAQSFCEAFSPLLLLTVFLHIVTAPLLLCLQAFLSVAAISQESVFMPSAWRSHLHMTLKHNWGHHVGLFPVASSPYKRSLECGRLPSHVTCPSHCMRFCSMRARTVQDSLP